MYLLLACCYLGVLAQGLHSSETENQKFVHAIAKELDFGCIVVVTLSKTSEVAQKKFAISFAKGSDGGEYSRHVQVASHTYRHIKNCGKGQKRFFCHCLHVVMADNSTISDLMLVRNLNSFTAWLGITLTPEKQENPPFAPEKITPRGGGGGHGGQ